MKIRDFLLVVILLFIAQGFAFADRQLDKAEILQVFKTLTDQPRKTWIPAGTIEATHLEYKASEGYITESTVIVRYDGDRFYWEINIDSHTRQTESQGTYENLDLNWNTKRVFAWDGQRYTRYFRPGNHAIVTENPSDIPVKVNGPLTAGIVPWGYGVYTLESLLAAESSAKVDDRGQVHLTLNKTNMPEMVFVLDPTKDYAVLSYSMNYVGHSSIVKTYGDYELVSGQWIPTTIVIERYDDSKQPSELLSYDEWNLTSISVSAPQPDSFSVAYETGALVKYYSSITNRPLWYRYSNEVDIDSLLQDRLAIMLAGDTQTQKCAVVAMKYVAAQLGKDVTGQRLAGLVNEPNEDTSLYQLQQFARELGFHCLAVKTDVQTLQDLKNCQAILHLPRAEHYVVLEHVDDEYVWLIDLDANNFYYHTRIDEFGLDWSEGTALLLSNESLDSEGTFTEINDEELHKIIGSLSIPNYSCSDKIQEPNIIQCPPPTIFGLCVGRYYQLEEVWGCKEDTNGSGCNGTGVVGYFYCNCMNHPYDPFICIDTGDNYVRYIRGCCK